MSPGDLRALLAAEKADALSAMSASKLSEERASIKPNGAFDDDIRSAVLVLH